jgi:homoserine acetyltransferase
MGTWDGYDLLSLARTWQSADLTLANLTAGCKPVHTSTADALKSMTPVRVLVMPSRTDLYFVV